MTERRNDNADYLTAGISRDKVNLMNLTAISKVISDYLDDALFRLKNAEDGKISAQDGEEQTVDDVRVLANAFTGKDPDDYTTSDWNGEPLARHLLATQDASIFTYADPNDPASVVANYLASLFSTAASLTNAHANAEITAYVFHDAMAANIRNASKALLGLPVL